MFSSPEFKKYLTEFLGTLFLVFVIFYTGNWVAIGFGLAIPVLLGGAISGGAFNPAVAVCLYLAKNKHITTVKTLLFYIISELLGATAGFLICNKLLKSN